MSIQKIGFTAALLPKQPAQAQEIKQESQVVTEKQAEVQPQEQAAATDVIKEENPNHTIRNWSIGLGAAATLISLGVAGRRGHLGKGLQKLLGGAEKESGKLADDIAGAAEHTNPHVSTATEEISAEEFSQVVNREADFVQGETKSTEEIDKIFKEISDEIDAIVGSTKTGEEAASKAGAKAEAPKLDAPAAKPAETTPKPEAPKPEAPKPEAPKPEAQKAEAPKADAPKAEAPAAKPAETTPNAEAPHTPKVEYSGAPITEEEIKVINDSLEKSLPKVTEDMLRFDMSKIPTADTYEKVIFDTLKIPKTGVANSKQTFTHEGKEAIAHFGEDGRLKEVKFESLNGEKIDINLSENGKIHSTFKSNSNISAYYYYGKNQPDYLCLDKNGYEYYYFQGSLDHCLFKNAKGETIKMINYTPGTSSIEYIEYYKPYYGIFSTQKTEAFKDGKLRQEIFYKESGLRTTSSVLTYL